MEHRLDGAFRPVRETAPVELRPGATQPFPAKAQGVARDLQVREPQAAIAQRRLHGSPRHSAFATRNAIGASPKEGTSAFVNLLQSPTRQPGSDGDVNGDGG
jgi:hypothetical protein